MAYYIGIDGGGTKTLFALFDENKNKLSEVYGGGSNHENLEGSFEEAANIIMNGINELLEKSNLKLSDIKHTLMGLAGIDHEFQHENMCDELGDRGLEEFSVYNDGYIVVKAGATGKAAIGYNCGTGTCCNSIDSDGKMLQIGGFGQLSGDEGNGYWIAAQTFRAIYDDICLKKRPTVMTQLFCKAFGKDETREGLLSSIGMIEGYAREKSARTLIDILFEAANQNDEAALLITEEMAQRGADFITAHTRIMNFTDEEIEVVLSGSMHTKLPNDKYISRMKEIAQQQSGRKLKFIKLDVPPVTGCINWMLQNEEN